MYQVFSDTINKWFATMEEAKRIAKQHSVANQGELVQVAERLRQWSDSFHCIVSKTGEQCWYLNGAQV